MDFFCGICHASNFRIGRAWLDHPTIPQMAGGWLRNPAPPKGWLKF